MVFTSTMVSLQSRLVPEENFTLDLGWLRSVVKDKTPEGLVLQEGLEFVVLLLHFEREVDHKQYIYFEPFHVIDGVPVAFADSAISGPLSRICSPPDELVYEYFKRHPLEMPQEIYNKNYLFGYVPTGCLGPIQWLEGQP